MFWRTDPCTNFLLYFWSQSISKTVLSKLILIWINYFFVFQRSRTESNASEYFFLFASKGKSVQKYIAVIPIHKLLVSLFWRCIFNKKTVLWMCFFINLSILGEFSIANRDSTFKTSIIYTRSTALCCFS